MRDIIPDQPFYQLHRTLTCLRVPLKGHMGASLEVLKRQSSVVVPLVH